MFRQEFRLGVLRGAERTLPPWLKVPGNDRNPKASKEIKLRQKSRSHEYQRCACVWITMSVFPRTWV
jgi:hypothetical protein